MSNECGENTFGYCQACKRRAVTILYNVNGRACNIPLCATHGSKYLVAAVKAAFKTNKAPRRKRAPKVESILAELRDLAPAPKPSITIWAA